MTKDFVRYMMFLLLFFFLLAGCKQPPPLIIKTETLLGNFSSGSAVEYHKNQIYIAGDDAPFLWIGTDKFNQVDSFRLDSSRLLRIPKPDKHDYEAATIVYDKRKAFLMLLGSGSLNPTRNKGMLIRLDSMNSTLISLDTIYKRFIKAGISTLNIEGAASIPGGILLANRGNKSYMFNHLIYCANFFWTDQDSTEFRIIKLGNNPDTSFFNGVSGMDYSERSDRLYLTVTTENTYSNHADGEIGKSYLWIIDDISTRRRFSALNPSKVIDLEKMDSRFKGQKIESVAVISEKKNMAELVLVADNDDGSTSIFIAEINLKKLE